jgi:hypothetical protein
MVCLGGSYITPLPGYWRSDRYSDNFVKCAYKEACLGGYVVKGNPRNLDEYKKLEHLIPQNNVSLNGICSKEYKGLACSECQPGFAKFGSNLMVSYLIQ